VSAIIINERKFIDPRRDEDEKRNEEAQQSRKMAIKTPRKRY
jgi:hypothetical protein